MHILNRTITESNLPNKTNKFNYKYFLLLALTLFFYGQNSLINVILVIIISLMFLFFIRRKEFILSYFALIFFEPILELPFVGGSFFRIYQLMFLILLFFEARSNKKYNFRNNMNYIAAIIFLALSFLYVESIEGIISSIINVLILIFITTYNNEKEMKEIYSNIFAVIAIFSTFSGIYGFIYGVTLNYGYVSRMGATIGDPNYSALFYTLGLFSLVGTHSIHKKIKLLLAGILCIFLLLTVSLTGILGTLFLFILFVGIKKMSKGILFGSATLLTFIVFLQSNLNRGTALYGLQYRILSVLNSNDLSVITSNRSGIALYYLNYFKGLPLINQLFGGNNTVGGIAREEMIKLTGNVAHNSFIDMLYMIGIFGTILMLALFVSSITRQIKKYKLSGDSIHLAIAFLKITILYYSLSISIFPFRYFYTFFIL